MKRTSSFQQQKVEVVGDPLSKEELTESAGKFEGVTRLWLTPFIMICCLAALLIAYYDHGPKGAGNVWSIVAVPIGAVIGHYYHRGKKQQNN